MNKKVSVIIPCYNEEKQLEKTMRQIKDFLKNKKGWEIIFVNDGSTDSTLEILKKHSKEYKIISYAPNRGKGFAIKKGVENSSGDFIGFIDADLAYSFENLENAFNQLEKFDIVIGSRKISENEQIRKIPFLRKLLGKSYSKISNFILGYNIPDSQCGLKAFKRSVAKDIFSVQGLKGFAFDSEILFIANKRRYLIKQIPAYLTKNHLARNSRVNLVLDPIRMLKDLIKIRINFLLGKYEKNSN